MSGRKAARFAARIAVVGAAAGTLIAASGYAMRASRAVPADPAFVTQDEPQMPNRFAKADRLTAQMQAAQPAPEGASYKLASIDPAAVRAPIDDGVVAEAAQPSAAEAADATRLAALASPPLPPKRPQQLLPPPPPAPSSMLDDAQIAGIKARLRLTAEQVEYWPAVESALRDVAKTHLRPDRVRHAHGKANIDVNSPEVQRLVWAAMPLLMRLREDQKQEVRKLARVIGLDSVASQI